MFKVLLNHEFYQQQKAKLDDNLFTGDLSLIWATIKKAHQDFARDISVDEIWELLKASNPVLTTAHKAVLAAIIEEIKEAQEVGQDVAKTLIGQLWRRETGLRVANIGLEISEGKHNDLTGLQKIIQGTGEDWLPAKGSQPLSNELEDILATLKERHRWEFNLPALKAKLKGLSGGEFGYVLSVSEGGKTAFAVSVMAAPGGFAWQGARCLYVGNEEKATRTQVRCVSAASGFTENELEGNLNNCIPKAAEVYGQIKRNLIFIDDIAPSVADITGYCKKYKPDIVLVDVLDKITIDGNYESDHTRLGAIYRSMRELAKLQDCAIGGFCQASDEGQDKTRVHYRYSSGSKTAKAAEADWIIGIGKGPPQDNGLDEDKELRYLFVSKDKRGGFNGLVVCQLEKKISRFVD